MLGPSASATYLRPGVTERVSVSSSGRQTVDSEAPVIGSTTSLGATLNANGRYVAFSSTAVNLVEGDINGVSDIFVHDRRTRRTQIVSIASNGAIAQTGVGACARSSANLVGSFDPAISANGRYVAFQSCAANLVPGDTNLAADIFLHDRRNSRTSRVSVASDGSEAQAPAATTLNSFMGSISPEGRFVSFSSSATNLVSDDTNEEPDTFLFDRASSKTERISVSSDGEQGDAASGCSALSRGARYIAFNSNARNLAPDDEVTASPLTFTDVFIRDRKKGKTIRASLSGNPPVTARGGNVCALGGHGISNDGRYVVFSSDDTAVVPNDTNSRFDVFVYDRETGRTERVSVNSDGTEATKNAGLGGISGNGRFVTLWSNHAYSQQDGGDEPSNRIPPSPLGDPDVFVYDLKTKSVDWVSLSSDNKESRGDCGSGGIVDGSGAYGESKYPGINANGRFVAFESCASNLVPGDTNRVIDVFVRDRGLSVLAGAVRVPGSGGGSGRGAVLVAAPNEGTGFVVGIPDADDDGPAGVATDAEIIGARLIYRPQLKDLLVWIDVDDLDLYTSVPLVYGLSLSVDGIGYELRAARIGGVGSSGARPAFALYRCTDREVCIRAGKLTGGWGTVGDAIVIRTPLAALGLEGGGELSGLEVFSALGGVELGPVDILDQAALNS